MARKLWLARLNSLTHPHLAIVKEEEEGPWMRLREWIKSVQIPPCPKIRRKTDPYELVEYCDRCKGCNFAPEAKKLYDIVLDP